VLLRGVDEAQPDVVCRQDLEASDSKFPHRERSGCGAIWHGQKSWNGVANATRPPRSKGDVVIDDNYEAN
jgi:exodeoxyribonuclease-3